MELICEFDRILIRNTGNLKDEDEFLPRDAMHSTDYALASCLSVRYTLVFCQTAKHIFKLFVTIE